MPVIESEYTRRIVEMIKNQPGKLTRAMVINSFPPEQQTNAGRSLGKLINDRIRLYEVPVLFPSGEQAEEQIEAEAEQSLKPAQVDWNPFEPFAEEKVTLVASVLDEQLVFFEAKVTKSLTAYRIGLSNIPEKKHVHWLPIIHDKTLVIRLASNRDDANPFDIMDSPYIAVITENSNDEDVVQFFKPPDGYLFVTNWV